MSSSVLKKVTQGALTLGHLAVAVAVFTPNRAQICQCECGQANLATWERCAATVRAATVQMLMSRHAQSRTRTATQPELDDV